MCKIPNIYSNQLASKLCMHLFVDNYKLQGFLHTWMFQNISNMIDSLPAQTCKMGHKLSPSLSFDSWRDVNVPAWYMSGLFYAVLCDSTKYKFDSFCHLNRYVHLNTFLCRHKCWSNILIVLIFYSGFSLQLNVIFSKTNNPKIVLNFCS